MRLDRDSLRRFWKDILYDILEGKYIEDERAQDALNLATSWST